MILNGVIALILRFSLNSIALLADYVTVVEGRLTISVKYCLWVPVFHFRPKLMYPAARYLCDRWASCLIKYCEVRLSTIDVSHYPLRHSRSIWPFVQQEAQLSQRYHAAACVSSGQKVEEWDWETIFCGNYRSIFNHCDIIALQSYRIRWKKNTK